MCQIGSVGSVNLGRVFETSAREGIGGRSENQNRATNKTIYCEAGIATNSLLSSHHDYGNMQPPIQIRHTANQVLDTGAQRQHGPM
jgi:hypothetical protein